VRFSGLVAQSGCGRALRPGDPDQSVGSDPELAVAQSGHQFGGQGQAVARILDHHEVVAGPVVLGELELSHGSGSPTRTPSPPDAGPHLSRPEGTPRSGPRPPPLPPVRPRTI